MKANEYQSCAKYLKAIAEPERLRIVEILFQGERNVSDLAEALGDDIVKVSHHLGVLRRAGLVETRREGKFVVYQLSPSVTPRSGDCSNGTTNPFKVIDFGCCTLDLTGVKNAKK